MPGTVLSSSQALTPVALTMALRGRPVYYHVIPILQGRKMGSPAEALQLRKGSLRDVLHDGWVHLNPPFWPALSLSTG